MAERIGETKKRTAEVFDAVLDLVVEESKKDGINVVDYFKTTVKELPARTARNPKTGETIDVAEKKVVKIKLGSKFDIVE